MTRATAEDWNTHPLPEQRASFRMDLRFPARDMARIRRGLVPDRMEDKWFIYWQDDRLFFHRSWTGICIYVARFEPEGSAWRLVHVDVNRDPEQYRETSDTRDAQTLAYLIDVLLLQRDAPFPHAGASPERTAVQNWSLVGRAMMGGHPDEK